LCGVLCNGSDTLPSGSVLCPRNEKLRTDSDSISCLKDCSVWPALAP
jgi:hypothetical protein